MVNNSNLYRISRGSRLAQLKLENTQAGTHGQGLVDNTGWRETVIGNLGGSGSIGIELINSSLYIASAANNGVVVAESDYSYDYGIKMNKGSHLKIQGRVGGLGTVAGVWLGARCQVVMVNSGGYPTLTTSGSPFAQIKFKNATNMYWAWIDTTGNILTDSTNLSFAKKE
jgi:hypothetical protein